MMRGIADLRRERVKRRQTIGSFDQPNRTRHCLTVTPHFIGTTA